MAPEAAEIAPAQLALKLVLLESCECLKIEMPGCVAKDIEQSEILRLAVAVIASSWNEEPTGRDRTSYEHSCIA
jgi:hypothetical protein